MKFSDGYWLNQPGYTISFAKQAYQIEITKNGIKILATPERIFNRGQTLAGPNLEITVYSTLANTIRVSVVHYKGAQNHGPDFELAEDADFKPIINDHENYVELISGETRAVVSKLDWSIEYYYLDRRLTSGGSRSFGYVKEQNSKAILRRAQHADDNFFAYPSNPGNTYMTAQLSLDVGEYVYGFGEKFTPFVKNGQTVDIWNCDGGTSCEQSYKSIPFYVTSNGYGIFVNNPGFVSFEVASETVSNVSITVPGERMEYIVIGGENLSQVISCYTRLTGLPALPPAYSFGLWLTTSFTTKYDENTINEFIDGMAKRDIPLSCFHFDCFWMKEFEWCSFDWDLRQFPDPAAMLKRLHESKNLKVCVWINPYIGQRSRLFDEGVKNGYFVLNRNGSVFQCDLWQPGMAIVDFTNPEAVKWYQDRLRSLCEMGVDCFKTDFGERIPADAVYHSGADPIKMHNYYSFLYNSAVFEVLKDYYGENNACVFARSAAAGSQQFPVHWGGDCSADYPSMAETLRGGLSLCISGFGFFSHDISGFESTATPDLYKRWCAFGLLSTHSRLHGNSSYRVPWLFDEEACDVLRFFTNLKGRLMPYIFSSAIDTHLTGVPMMRAMVLDYASDHTCRTLDRQYMLGKSLLCAPIINDKSTALFYLPKGRWTDIITNTVYEGEKWYEEKMDYFRMPVLASPNSIIVWGRFDKSFEYDYLENATAVIYELDDGKQASCRVYSKDAEMIADISAKRTSNRILVEYTKTDKSFDVVVSGTGISARAEAGTDSLVIEI